MVEKIILGGERCFLESIRIEIRMRIHCILVLKLLSIVSLTGQNLVSNGDFENYKHCPHSYLSKKNFLPSWCSPTRGTPDYFNACSKGLAGVPDNSAGKINSINGKGYVGFIVASLTRTIGIKNSYSREYISTELNSTLKKDSLYRISFLISHSLYSRISVNKISVYFSKKKVRKATKYELKLTPQINFDISMVPKKKWIFLSAEYKAQGDERFLTIGNFQSDMELVWTKTPTDSKSPNVIGAYYYIDDVMLIPLGDNQVNQRNFTY
jgi:OmpA-OmpF porin, OOP family